MLSQRFIFPAQKLLCNKNQKFINPHFENQLISGVLVVKFKI